MAACGGRGYKFGSLGTKEDKDGFPLKEVHQLASLGFIDDTICLTRTKEDMAIQLRKIEAFSSPSGYNLPVNNTKSATTAILHGAAAANGGPADEPSRLKSLLSGKNSMTLNGQPIPYYPPNKTYKYLGVEVCPAMEWSTQLEKTIEDVTKRGRQLAASMASPRQCLHIIRTCLKPKIAYAFGIAPYTMQEIGRLDRVLASIARKCCRLPRSMATASILLSTEKSGMGLISLTVDYATRAAESLTHALNDEGKLGVTTRAMLVLQQQRMGGAPVDELPTGSARYCTSLRKLQLMDRHNLQLTVNERPLDPIPTPSGSEGHPLTSQEDVAQILWNTGDAAKNKLVEHPDGWFSRLLRHPEVTSSFMAPLLSIGIRHIGQLVTATGTHIISTSDLALGRQVNKHHKQALNRLTIAICKVYPPGITKPTQMRTSEPLPLQYRINPLTLTMPQAQPTQERLGMHDIRKYLSRVRVRDTTNPDHSPIKVITTERTSRKTQKAQRQATTHRLYGREVIQLHQNHLSPADVNPQSPPGSLATFWQQRQELVASLKGKDNSDTYWRDVARDPACTWETFRAKVCTPESSTQHSLPIQLLASLYDTQYTITALRGPTVQYKHEGIRREYYTASWGNTVVCRHHLPMIMAAYKHTGTIIPNKDPDVSNHDLSFLTLPHTGTFVPPDMVVVKWEDLLHPKELSENLPNFTHLLHTNMDATPHHREAPPPPPTDAHLPDHIRQGIPTSSPCLNLPWATTRMVRSRVTFDLQACNPDLDIGVTKQYTLQEGLRHPDQCQAQPKTMGFTYAHSPTGSYIGKVTNPVLDDLRRQYEQMRQAYPTMHAENSTCFERDVAKLLRRYDPDTKNSAKTKPSNPLTHPHTPTGALPPAMWAALRSHLGIRYELFASPLDRSPHSEAYWSAHAEDQLFGANYDAFSRPWTGACQAYIGDCPEANDKAVRHALGSVTALPESTTCIIMFIPSKDPEAPHMRHLTDPRVRLIATMDIGN